MGFAEIVRAGAGVLLATTAMTAASAASAQAGDGAGETEASGTGELSAIVVTAQRRAENMQDVPISVSAVSAENISATGVDSILNLGTLVSGMNTRTSGTGAAQFFVRGVGTSAGYAENSVALYVDDVYIANQRESAIDLFDVEQVSVLKGPQGTLFGRNASGGVVQVTTREPGSQAEAEFRAEIDNYARVKAAAYLAGGLAEGVSASVTAQYVDQGKGWGENRTLGEDIYLVEHALNLRAKLRFEFGDTTISLAGDYQDRKDHNGTNYVPFPGTGLLYPGYVYGGDVRDTYSDIRDTVALESGGVSARIEHAFGGVDLKSVTAYRTGENPFTFDLESSPARIQWSSGLVSFENFSQEFQLSSSNPGPIEWVVGAFYFKNKIKSDTLDVYFDGPVSPDPTSLEHFEVYGAEDTEAIAGFGQLKVGLGAYTNVTLGLRYSHEKRDFVGTTTGFLNNGNQFPMVPTVTDSVTSNSWTWRIAVDHEIAPNVLAYASWDRGFKSGGFNITSTANPPYDPERLDAYEIGVKSELFDRSVRLNLAAFYYDYTDIQVLRIVNTPIIENGAKAEVYGLDADVEVQFGSGFSLLANGSLLNAKFTEFPGAQYGEPLPGGGLVLVSGDASGNWLPFAQPWQASVSLNKEFDTSFGRIMLNVTNSFNDGFYTEPNNQTRQGAHSLLSASATWTSRDEKLSLRLWGTNLLDEAVVSSVSAAAAGYLASYGSPPTRVGLTGTVRF